MTAADRRVRRPEDKAETLRVLTEEGPFEALRDALVFAAALGQARNRRVPFSKSGEPIRWDVMANRRGTEALVSMLAVAAQEPGESDPTVLADDRFEQRITIFEEFANGGLEILASELAGIDAPTAVVNRLVSEALREQVADTAPELDKLVDELGL